MIHDVIVPIHINVFDVAHPMFFNRLARPESDRTWVNRRGIEIFSGENSHGGGRG